MKSKTLLAAAVASAFTCGSAFAGGFHHSTSHSGMHQNAMQGSSVEVIAPSSVDESAPWTTNKAHSAGWTRPATSNGNQVIGMQEGQFSDGPVGTSASMSGSGFGGYDSTSMSTSAAESLSMSEPTGYDATIYGLDYTLADLGGTDYWLWGDESTGTGASSSASGSGFGGFDSATNLEQSFDTMSSLSADDSIGYDSGQYILWGPLSQADADDLVPIVADSGIVPDLSISALSEGYTVLTPIYDDVASFSDSEFGYKVSQFDDYSGD